MTYLFAFVTVLREALEAGLLVCLLAASLRRTGCSRRIPYVWLGLGASVLPEAALLSAASWGVRILAGQAHLVTEAVFLAVSTAAVTGVILWFRQTAQQDLAGLLACPRFASPFGVFALAFLLTAREGLETVLLLAGPVVRGTGGAALLVSALSAAALAALASFLVYCRFAVLPLRSFFATSGALLVLLGAGLLSNTIQSWQYLRWLPTLPIAWDTSRLLPPTSLAASLLGALVGYNARPTILEAVAWWTYVLVVGRLYLGTVYRRRRPGEDKTAITRGPRGRKASPCPE